MGPFKVLDSHSQTTFQKAGSNQGLSGLGGDPLLRLLCDFQRIYFLLAAASAPAKGQHMCAARRLGVVPGKAEWRVRGWAPVVAGGGGCSLGLSALLPHTPKGASGL